MFSTTSKFWSFLFKVGLIVAVFFAVKTFMSGGNRTGPGGVRPMGTGPDHRPPGKFLRFILFYCLNIGGGGGGWFSNLFPGGFGGFGGSSGGSTPGSGGGTPGSGDARRRQPPPPGFRTDFDDASKLNKII